MYLFKEYFIKIAVKSWEHPKYPFYYVIPQNVREGILKLINFIGHLVEGLGAMAGGYLVYFAYIEGMLTAKHWILIGIAGFFMLIIIITALIQTLQRSK